jgi:hypothetical protein
LNGQDNSIEAARAGMANAYAYGSTPPQRFPEITVVEAEAKAARRGLWGQPCACRIRSAFASRRRVEPSTSVNKNVTTPKEQPSQERTPPQNLTPDTLLPGTSAESDLDTHARGTETWR